MNWIHTVTPCSFSVGDAVTGSRRFILKSYPQPFVIRIFFPFILRYARFPEKNMRIKIYDVSSCRQPPLAAIRAILSGQTGTSPAINRYAAKGSLHE